MQEQDTGYNKGKNKVFEIYGEKEFKNDFPIASNRTAIYKKVNSGEEIEDACKSVLENLSAHEKAQRQKKLKHTKK